MEKIQPRDNLEGHKATLLIQMVVVITGWNDISKRKPSRHNQIQDERSLAPAQAGSGGACDPSGPLSPSTAYSISQPFWGNQKERVLFPFPLNVNPPGQGAWVFPGGLSKRGETGLLLIWAGVH